MKLFLNPSPRSVAIVSNKHALLIQDPLPVAPHHRKYIEDLEVPRKCVVEFVESSKIDPLKYVDLMVTHSLSCLGVLGLVCINEYSFLVIVTRAKEVGSPRPREKIYSVEDVEFLCLNSTHFDASFGRSNPDSPVEDCTSTLRKTLVRGHFYFSNAFDLTTTRQNGSNSGLGALNKRFLWNKLLLEELVNFRGRLGATEKRNFDECRFLSIAIRGFVQTVNCSVALENQTKDSLLTLVSRIGTERSGKLFGPSGLDEEGNVANYVESELIFYNENYTVAYTIVRGNAPLYFEIDSQQSSSLLKRLVLTRPFDATQQAFSRHFETLLKTFGEIHIVNGVLSALQVSDIEGPKPKKSKGIEHDMFRAYYDHYVQLTQEIGQRDLLRMSNFTFSLLNLEKSQVVFTKILLVLEDLIYRFAAFCVDNANNTQLNKQSGVFRVCSFDAMDKCNQIERIILQQVLLCALNDAYLYLITSKEVEYGTFFSLANEDLWSKLALLWENNGKALNRIIGKYSAELRQVNKKGTGSTEEERKNILKGFTDLTVSTSKKLFNLSNYKDLLSDLAKRNNAIFVLLGQDSEDYAGNVVRPITLYDPVNDYVSAELKKASQTYRSEKQISVFAGTFNVNGMRYEGSLGLWLFPNDNGENITFDTAPDLFYIGLQEIVELTPGQMMAVDQTNRSFWEQKLLQEINSRAKSANLENKIILLWSAHLGGLLLLLFVKTTHVRYIKKVEESMKKTGLGGMAANKGGIAVSVQYSDTLFCFVSSHLAAGLNNVEERRQNYKSLNAGLRFMGNKTIKAHDVIIWLGDFNFRIDNFENEAVRTSIMEGRLEELLEHDQLNRKMRSGVVFPFYEEHDITFAPTYKFNPGEDAYDTLEKMRIPAWCDRILHRSKQLRQVLYGAAFDIKFLDHRPVYGLFYALVALVNEEVRNKLLAELYEKTRARYGEVNSVILSGKVSVGQVLPGGDELQPPSNDNVKWWFSQGMLARVELFRNIRDVKEFDQLSKEDQLEILQGIWHPEAEFAYSPGMKINGDRDVNPFVGGNEWDFIEL